jgi:hypothetical protein
MSKMKDLVQWQTVSGEAVRVGEVALTPQSQALTLHWPKGGFVWNRPVPVVDVTRIAQLTLLGLGFVFFVVALMLSVRKRSDENE